MSLRIPLIRPEKALFWLLVALLAWVPIPLGSNRVWAWSVLEIATFLLVALWAILWAAGKASPGAAVRSAWPVFALLAAWLLHQALHVVPLPATWVEVLSPEAARIQHLTDSMGIARDAMTLSLDPHASRGAIVKSLAYLGIFFLVLALANNRQRVLTLARVLVYAAVLHAIYAVMMHLSGASEEFFGAVIPHGTQASGTFVNRNHFAGFLEMMLALGIGLLIAGLSDRRADSWRHFVRHLLEWILSPKMLLRLSLCILVIALTTTHSRMGNTAFFASLFIAGLVGILLSRYATRSTVVLLVSLVAIDLVIVGSWFGVEKLAQRLEQTTAGEVEFREEPAAYTLQMIKDYPVFGAGPGTFYVTFPRYRPRTITAFFDFAHNDYAQIASESGVVGLGLLGLAVLVTLAAALRAQWRRRDPLMRGMSFACIMGVVSILIHSWVDFNLQIPANAAMFMVLLALGWIAFALDRRQGDAAPVRQTDDPSAG